MNGKPTIPEVLPLIQTYCQKNGNSGHFHIVLDDVNVGDDHVRFCIEQANAAGDQDGVAIGELLLRMSKTQRSKLSKLK